MAKQEPPIGYFNNHSFPIQFPLRSGRGVIALEPGQPIVDRDNLLVAPGRAELDEEVRLGTIHYIPAGHKTFSGWNAKATQMASGRKPLRGDDGFPVEQAPRPPKPATTKIKVTDVSAAKPTTTVTEKVEPEGPKPPTNVFEDPAGAGDDEGAGEGEEEGTKEVTIDEFIDAEIKAGRMERRGNNALVYQGQEFRGKKALLAYLQQQQQAAAA